MIQREDLKTSVMDRSSNYRLKVESDKMSNFFSEKTKLNDWMRTLRPGNSIPNSLKNTIMTPMSQKRAS